MLRETVDVVLRGGGTVHVRPSRPEDEQALARFLGAMSPESRYLRFFSGAVNVAAVARRIADPPDPVFALVAVTGGRDERIVGVAELAEIDRERAEVAFAVADELQGQGLGTVLLAHLAQHARVNGYERLVAHVLPNNMQMANVFRDSGFAFTVRRREGELVFEAPATLTAEGLARFEERQRIATAASVGRVLRPGSVGVLGPVREPGSTAATVVDTLRAAGYTGTLRVVEPGEDLSDPVDLLVIAVPAAAVLDAARMAAARGCGALLVLSGGFAESGPEGVERQRRLVAICRSAGMRLVGPNCLGVACTDADVRLNATAGVPMPPAGNVALLTQSGALLIALLERAGMLGLRLSSFAAVGNKADLSGNDLLQYWEADEGTDVVMLYLESFGNPRNFARIARRMSASKPIVAVKSGRTPAGARATATHTGSLLASSDVSVDALFRQAGVVRASTLAEFLDVGALLARQPVPRGPRVAIVTDAGGPGVLAADACAAFGLELPEPSETLRDELRRVLPSEAALVNPVDLLATAAPQDYARAIRAVAGSGEVDAVIAIAVHVDAADAVAAAGADGELPLALVQMAGERRTLRAGPPVYRFPEEAARALARAVEYGRWRAEPRGEPPEFEDVRRDEAAALLRGARKEPRWLEPAETARLLACWGLPLVEGAPPEGGVEMLVGVTHDRLFGPVVACGPGGPGAELERDVAVRLTPVTSLEAAAMVRELRTFPLLDGWKGAPPADVAALEDIVVRTAAMADAHPEIVELDLDPIAVLPRGAAILEARVRVAAPAPEPLWPAIGASPPRW